MDILGFLHNYSSSLQLDSINETAFENNLQ